MLAAVTLPQIHKRGRKAEEVVGWGAQVGLPVWPTLAQWQTTSFLIQPEGSHSDFRLSRDFPRGGTLGCQLVSPSFGLDRAVPKYPPKRYSAGDFRQRQTYLPRLVPPVRGCTGDGNEFSSRNKEIGGRLFSKQRFGVTRFTIWNDRPSECDSYHQALAELNSAEWFQAKGFRELIYMTLGE